MKKTFQVDRNLLIFPVKESGALKQVRILLDGAPLTYFDIPIDEEDPKPDGPRDFYGEFPVFSYTGKEITVEGDVPESFLEEVQLTDEPYLAPSARPAAHFTPDHGWMNDPNGLIFDGEYYHLHFQHNPFGKAWGNMSWGHAVSRDLLHWEQVESVLFPDECGTMWSGSGIVDEQNTLGHGAGTKVLFYTAVRQEGAAGPEGAAGAEGVAGSAGTAGSEGAEATEGENGGHHTAVQCICYSPDGGRTYHKDGVIVPTYARLNRDPKVYMYEPGGYYYMVLYLNGSEFAILNSTDLKNWTVTQRIELAPLWECPDLFPLKDERGDEVWVFMAADGFYYTGYFDGQRFTPMGTVKQGFATAIPYAAQTFYGTPDRRILLPWLRLKDPEKPYTGAMGLPRELSLRTLENGPELVLSPIREYVRGAKTLYGGTPSGRVELPLEQGPAYGLYLSGADFGLKLPSFTLELPGLTVEYHKDTLELMVDGVLDGHHDDTRMPKAESFAIDPEKPGTRTIRLKEALPSLFLLLDGNILEFTLNSGTSLWVLELKEENHQGTAVFTPEEEISVTVDCFRRDA